MTARRTPRDPDAQAAADRWTRQQGGRPRLRIRTRTVIFWTPADVGMVAATLRYCADQFGHDGDGVADAHREIAALLDAAHVGAQIHVVSLAERRRIAKAAKGGAR